MVFQYHPEAARAYLTTVHAGGDLGDLQRKREEKEYFCNGASLACVAALCWCFCSCLLCITTCPTRCRRRGQYERLLSDESSNDLELGGAAPESSSPDHRLTPALQIALSPTCFWSVACREYSCLPPEDVVGEAELVQPIRVETRADGRAGVFLEYREKQEGDRGERRVQMRYLLLLDERQLEQVLRW